jgi:hypothetical protein
VHSETPTDAVHLPNPLLPGFNPDPSCIQVGDSSTDRVRSVSGPGPTHNQNGIGQVFTLRWSLEVNR